MPSFIDVEVGIARTVPALEGAPPVAEIRRLYLDLIASARRSIYIENQYFTARELGDALAERHQRGPVLLVGLGGVGMMGLAVARALFREPPIVADIDAAQSNHIAQEGAVGFRVGAVEQDVNAMNHGA